MSVFVHALAGCAPDPLAHYLKALGVLRLVAQQADPTARGFWSEDSFKLVTQLSREELVRFFLDRYEPSPLVAPWNGGSGFYAKDNKDGFDALKRSSAERFGAYRAALQAAAIAVGKRKERPKDEDKQDLVASLRAAADPEVLDWLEAVVVMGSEKLEYPSLLGTGGNDGHLDFTNNQMQRLVQLFDPKTGAALPLAERTVEPSLFGENARKVLHHGSIGQFFPGGAGGANGSRGFRGSAGFNPWDYVFSFEGALVFRVAAVRKLDGSKLPQASAPFAFTGNAEGYASASSADESSRGEQWLPLWSAPASLAEVESLFAEGRLQAGRHRAKSALDAARAVAQMGSIRGVSEFMRYGFIERNGLSNLAVPLGRWRVRSSPQVRLLDELDPWVQSFRIAVHSKGSASLEMAVRNLEGAMLEVCSQPDDPARWIEVLEQAGAAEQLMVDRPRWTRERSLRPLPPLSAGWLKAADDRSPEIRLAAAIASQDIRRFMAPVDAESGATRFIADSNGLRLGPDQVWSGRDLGSDLSALVARVVRERGEHKGTRDSGSEPTERVAAVARGAGQRKGFGLRGLGVASLDDVSAFLDEETDDRRIARLARGLVAIRWKEAREVANGLRVSGGVRRGNPLFALFRWIYRPARSVDDHVVIDPEPVRLLEAGRLSDATKLALRRIAASQLRPRFHFAEGAPRLAHRLAASLAIPFDDEQSLRKLLTKPQSKDHEAQTRSTRDV